jgi:hypothetical protein
VRAAAESAASVRPKPENAGGAALEQPNRKSKSQRKARAT